MSDRTDNSATPFFRPEAIEQQKTRWLGEIQMAHPFSFWMIGMAAVAIAVAILLFFTFASHTKRATVTGRLVPEAGLHTLVAAQGGRIVGVNVVEGARVAAGDALFVLSLEREGERASHESAIAEKLTARQATLDSERHQHAALASAETQRLRDRKRSLEIERSQLERELSTAQTRLGFAERNVERFKTLAAQGFVSGLGAQVKEEELLDLRSRAQAIERTRTALDREIATVESELVAAPLRAATAVTAVAKQSAALDQERVELGARRTVTVRAAEAGVVTALSAQVGQWVAPGHTLATLLPSGSELVAELFAPSRAIGFVDVGQRVLMRLAPFPYQKFGQQSGEVLEVSRTAIPPRELPAGALPSVSGEALYRVRVRMDRQTISAYGREQLLSAGTQLDADIELDRRRVIEWVFEPLLSLKGRIAS